MREGQHTQSLVAAVLATPTAGTINAGTTIALSTTTAGATIYYTADGSDPKTSATRKVYSSPIIANTFVLKAYGTRAGLTDSAVTSLAYTRNASSVVDITAHGAVPGDGVDDTAKIQAAINAAKVAGKAVFIPAGTFEHNDELTFDGVDLVGTGPASILYATNPLKQNITITGAGVTVSDLKLWSTASQRERGNDQQHLIIERATDFIIERVTVDGSSAAGIYNYGGVRGVIRDNTVLNTRADGIHNTCLASDITIEHNTVHATGDDLIAVVSYREPKPPECSGESHHITIRRNDVSANVHGRGIAVLGGNTITVEDNRITRPKHMGLLVATQSNAYKTEPARNIVFRGNRVEEAGGRYALPTGGEERFHAVEVTAAPDYEVTGIRFIGNQILNSRWRGVLLAGGAVGAVEFTGNLLKTTNASGIVIETDFQGTATFTGNTVEETLQFALHHKEPAAGASLTLDGNLFRNVNASGNASQDVIRIEKPLAGNVLAGLRITNNRHENLAGYAVNYFINEQASAATEVICGNTSPRLSNATTSTLCPLPNVTASPAAGAVRAGATLSLSSSAGATLYYTTDGSDPRTSPSRKRYSSPILANAFTLKAYATREGMADSDVTSQVYTRDASGHVDITAHGAVASDGVDDTAAIRAAITAARATARAVFVPAGTFHHNDALVFDSVSLLGTGPGSILHATNPDEQNVTLKGAGVVVGDLKLTSSATVRQGSNVHQRLVIEGAADFIVERVTIDGASASGIFNNQGTRGVIRDNIVRNTLIGGIHSTNAASHTVIEYNSVSRTGDDLVSIASYQGTDPVSAITFRRNTLSGNTQGTGIAVRGGTSILIEENDITEPHVAGIYISSSGSAGTHGAEGITVRGNKVSIAGGQIANHGALMVHATGLPVTDVSFSENQVLDSRGRGILLLGSSIGAVRFSDNELLRTGGNGILIDSSFTGTAVFTDNLVAETGSYAFFHKAPQSAASITLEGNTFRDINTSAGSGVDVIHLESGGLAALTLTNNTHVVPVSHPLQYFIEEGVNAGTQVISGNSSPLPSRLNGVAVPTP